MKKKAKRKKAPPDPGPTMAQTAAYVGALQEYMNGQYHKDMLDLMKWPGAAQIHDEVTLPVDFETYATHTTNIQNLPKVMTYAEAYGMSAYKKSKMLDEYERLPYPGLSTMRRVVLDLCHTGFGLSAEIVDKRGELLAIAPPEGNVHRVAGAVVARKPLGLAVEQLLKLGTRFDLIVCELPAGLTTPTVGFFPAPRAPLAKSGRRLILPGMPAAPKPSTRLPMFLAVWRAMLALLAEDGEALLRVPRVSFADMPPDEPGPEKVWWVQHRGAESDLYVRNDFTNGANADRTTLPPSAADRCDRLRHPRGKSWTPAQTHNFKTALLPP